MTYFSDEHSPCKYCDEDTHRQERGPYTGYRWEYICSDCDLRLNENFLLDDEDE